MGRHLLVESLSISWRAWGSTRATLSGACFLTRRILGGWNESEWAVIEIDESDGTIEAFSPDVTIILNADHDHHAYYARYEDYLEEFLNDCLAGPNARQS